MKTLLLHCNFIEFTPIEKESKIFDEYQIREHRFDDLVVLFVCIEKNDDDVLSTIKNLIMLPKPYTVLMFNLSYFDDTELFDQAVSDGIIEEHHKTETYRQTLFHVWKYKHDSVYLNIVAAMMHGQVKERGPILGTVYGVLPERVLNFLIKKPVIKFFNKLLKYLPFKHLVFNVIAGFVITTYYGIKGLRHLLGVRTHSMGT